MYKTLAACPHSLMFIHVRDVHVLIHTHVGVILNACLSLMRSLLRLKNWPTGREDD